MKMRARHVLLLVAVLAAGSFVVKVGIAGIESSIPTAASTSRPSTGVSVSPPPSPSSSVSKPPTTQSPPTWITKLKPGEKPPQFVITAFDGSGDVDQLADWARITKQVHGNVTYFLSGVFMLYDKNGRVYRGPHKPVGYSAIQFRRPWEEPIPQLAALLSQAWLEGNDIGTHFNGHFCDALGVRTWSTADWLNELKQFNDLLDNWQENNDIADAPPLSFNHTVSVGGRTPCLQGKPAAYLAAMKQLGYRYDTSRTGALEWPRKTLHGLWEFPLPTVKWMGSKGGSTLIMDYNLWHAYNRNQPITTEFERIKVAKYVYATYLAAFNATYNGYRAPLFLGSHMNYWGCDQTFRNCLHTSTKVSADETPTQHYGPFTVGLQQAYQAICIKPNVACVSYKQLADWLDAQSPTVIAQLQAQGAVSG